MGSVLSFPTGKARARDHSNMEGCKRPRMSSSFDQGSLRLIPGLPDEISLEILARLPRICYLKTKMVSRSWKSAITGLEVYKLRRELGKTEEWLYILAKVEGGEFLWHALDPLSRKWQKLPPMPYVVDEDPRKGLPGLHMWNVIGSGIKIAGDIIRSFLGRMDSFEKLPFCGCAIGAVDGCLYVLGGFSRNSAMNCVWRYDPCVNVWQEVTSMITGRAFCRTSLLNNKLYVVGGVTKSRGGLTPLESAEVYDPDTGLWTQVPSMPFSRAQYLPTAFLAELLKPIATGMTSYRGRLCVPQSLYSWPFFVDVGGEIYDPKTNSWVDMPSGMGEGWPAKQAGKKLSVVVNDELYALDPSSSSDSGKIKIYDHQEDAWKVAIKKVPQSDFIDSETPYLLAAFLGKLHIITKDFNNKVAVSQADLKHTCSSSGLQPSFENSASQNSDMLFKERESEFWKVIAAKNFGPAELISCEVLDI